MCTFFTPHLCTLPPSILHASPSAWSKTTLNRCSVGGSGADLPNFKKITFLVFLMPLGLKSTVPELCSRYSKS